MVQSTGPLVVEASVASVQGCAVGSQLVDAAPVGTTAAPGSAGELGGAAEVMNGPETAQAITAAQIATTTVTRRAKSSSGEVPSSSVNLRRDTP
jgi:hypothetical protein